MQKRLGLSELLKAKLLEEQKEAQQTIAKLKVRKLFCGLAQVFLQILKFFLCVQQWTFLPLLLLVTAKFLLVDFVFKCIILQLGFKTIDKILK